MVMATKFVMHNSATLPLCFLALISLMRNIKIAQYSFLLDTYFIFLYSLWDFFCSYNSESSLGYVKVHTLYQYSCSALREGPFYLKIQAQAYVLLLLYLLWPFLYTHHFPFALFRKYSETWAERSGLSLQHCDGMFCRGPPNLRCVLSSELQSFQAHREMKRT